MMKLAPEVGRAIRQAYPPDEWVAVTEALVSAELPMPQGPLHSEERTRVHLAILRLARGNMRTLQAQIEAAVENDWRDTLCAAGLAGDDWRQVLAAEPLEHVSCAWCEEQRDDQQLSGPPELATLLVEVKARLARGMLALLPAEGEQAQTYALRDDGTLPAILDQTFRCQGCGRDYRLIANVGAGTGGTWFCTRGAVRPGAAPAAQADGNAAAGR